MRIVFAGSPPVALPVLEYLEQSAHDLVAVLSRPDAPSGRGRKMAPSAVSSYATQHDLMLYQPKTLKNNAEAATFLRDLQPDLGIVVAYGAILPADILEIPQFGWINIHFSLLPRWRGAAPVQRALQAGDTETGVTVFQLEPALDTGPIYATCSYTVPEQATAGDVLQELAELSVKPLEQALSMIARGVAPEPQSDIGITYASPLQPAEGEIDWSAADDTIACQIKGFTPSPGAWTMWQGSRMKLGVLEVNPPVTMPIPSLEPGQIFTTRHEVWVGTGSAPVCLGAVAPAGKKPMPADAWARGAHLESGAKFEPSHPMGGQE
ncbi:methionyl-tRNA formyltransferase [Mobiluncus curtisii]|uniref:methionyl-tRNA formyltransferase n=1 Tax=Mobiluncus curtisii TaxID=2051 RepID=UPI00147069E4|nr:methionyl-tRNA formyltransferase [Mobiluncus curtisii]NMW44646.1 methionyl-tRNA formyltransferase [Mobiluncus curtisii]NMW89310.1 methionyl-tRNA formyltransferase [Mobiluncus curtisii]